MLRENKDALGRLFGTDYPSQENVNSFERCLAKYQQEICSQLPDSVYDHVGTWGHAKIILQEADRKCTASRNEGVPNISQVYLLLAHNFVLLKEGLYDPALDAVTKVTAMNKASREVLAMLRAKETNMVKSRKDNSIHQTEVTVIRNVRNALAHSRIKLKAGEDQVLCYRGAELDHDHNTKSRPLVDVQVLGELMSSFALSVVKESGKIQEVHRRRESLQLLNRG
jgi:hypothetical protein